MLHVIQRLSFGIGAIAIASAVLLLSDAPARRPRARSDNPAEQQYRIAVMQHASQLIIEEGYAGLIAGLEESGFAEGRNLTIRRFNAEGDVATATAMAQEMIGGDYDLAVTLTTPSLQALANANKDGKVRHVFALVTDPVATGVGIGKEPLDHPAHLVGLGTLQPVAESVRMARRMNPDLKRLGVVWNPAEINSEVNTRLCRQACAELGITLLEANAENTAGVREAAVSIITRDVDALWIGGDVTVLAAIDSMLGAARDSRIPVFTCIPGNATKGTLFDLGANYFEVGRREGVLAAEVLKGTPIKTLPVESAVPPKLFINTLALNGLRDRWSIPPELLGEADVYIDAQGTHEKKPAPAARAPSAPLAKKWRIRILEYVNIPDVEEAEKGVLDAIRESGLVLDRDYEYRVSNAQGDMATLNSMVDAAVSEQADLVITLSTPTLQAAMRRAQSQPVVFTFLANPFAAGAGKTDADHLPNITGAYGAGDMEGMVKLIRRLMPAARRVGAMYCPTEVNSTYNLDLFLAASKTAGLEVISMGVSTPSEVADTALALCGKEVDAICLPSANITAASFPSIAQAARRARLPVFAFLGGLAEQGAVVALARDYYDMGHDGGKVAVRVMRGEDASKIPFQPAVRTRLLLNREAARQCGIEFPDDLVKSADRIFGN
jgi:ABC-type uncharacterized transport system substrate-binding protein